MAKGIALFIDRNDGLSMRHNRDGSVIVTVRYVWHEGRRYTPQGIACYLRNEVLRKGTRPLLRTTSSRWRAGTRRTKKYARAAR